MHLSSKYRHQHNPQKFSMSQTLLLRHQVIIYYFEDLLIVTFVVCCYSLILVFLFYWMFRITFCSFIHLVDLTWRNRSLKMGPGVKEDKTRPKGGPECIKLSIIFLLLNINHFVAPVTGYSLRNCRISQGKALCTKNRQQVTEVPQDIPSTVEGIDLSSNKISKIHVSDFKFFPVLTTLDLNSNRITQIDTGAFANLTSLKKFNLNNNRLDALGDNLFYGLSNLAELRIHGNKIKSVASTSFKSLRSLTFLDISNNKLHQLNNVHLIIKHLPNLQVLYLQYNDINYFNSWELTNSSLGLTSLDLSQNGLKVFNITADIFPNLTWFNIGQFSSKKTVKWDVHNKTFLSRVSTLDISRLHLKMDDMKALLESVNSSLSTLRMTEMKHNLLLTLINISCTIPTMSQLRHNQLSVIQSHFFQLCVNVTELDLSYNQIQNIEDGAFRSTQGIKILTLSHNRLSSVPTPVRNLSNLTELDLSSNEITKLECQNFANMTKLRHLHLSNNSFPALQDCLFKDLIQLQDLKLQNNSISDLKSALKKSLPNLRQLHLNQNKLTAIKHGDFMGLRSLQNLSLHENQIRKLDKGCFIGLTNLTNLQLQANSLEEDSIRHGTFNNLKNLRKLDLSNNHIRYKKSSALHPPPFSNLSRLETLAFYVQRRRERAYLPCNILQGLTNLLVFDMRNLHLPSFPKDVFKYTPQLQTLDIRSNELSDLSPDLFSPIQSLEKLYISTTNLRSLDFLIDANLTKLKFIEAKKNQLHVIRKEIINSLPALVYLDLEGNSFTCDCDNVWFLLWVKKSNQTQVFDAYNFECNYPAVMRGRKLMDFDPQSCKDNIDFICFISTTSTILLLMVVSYTYHFLRWQLAYAYYFFLALLFDAKNKNRQTHNQYDAFISYNAHDEPWVIRQLLPKLEDEQGWRLCLHHRDFEPGKTALHTRH